MNVKGKKIHSYFNDNNLNIEELMHDYYKYIYTLIKNTNIIFSNEDIEEICHDVFVAIWNNRDKLDINKKMSSYIFGITKNLIKMKSRNKKLQYNIEDYEKDIISQLDVETIAIKNEELKNLRKELEKFKLIDKNIFLKYYYEEKSIKEISCILNMSESKIKSKLFRIRKKLKKVLKDRREY